MGVEPTQEILRKAAEQLGIKEGGEYRLVYTKKLTIEPIAKTLNVADVLPYPLPKADDPCHICGKPFAQHGFLPYFSDPKHISSVRNFTIALMEKLDLTKNMPLKLAVEAPSTVLNPKEIVEGIFTLIKEDVNLANHYILAITHYTPSESVRFALESGRGSLSQRLFQTERHYMGLCREWRSEIQIHKHLAEPVGFTDDVEKADGGSNRKIDLEQRHSEEVETDYFDIQSDFHLVTARVLAYEKMVKEFAKVGPYDIMRRSIEKRQKRLTYPAFSTFPSYSFPVRRRSATRSQEEL